MSESPNTRMIDRWFPIAAVDAACATPAGSGLTEKAIFTWFASRPIAQARAAALTALLPDEPGLRTLIEAAVRHGDRDSIDQVCQRVTKAFDGKAPVVLDMFSGRGIIPPEASPERGQSPPALTYRQSLRLPDVCLPITLLGTGRRSRPYPSLLLIRMASLICLQVATGIVLSEMPSPFLPRLVAE